jgi:hypothetical protein
MIQGLLALWSPLGQAGEGTQLTGGCAPSRAPDNARSVRIVSAAERHHGNGTCRLLSDFARALLTVQEPRSDVLSTGPWSGARSNRPRLVFASRGAGWSRRVDGPLCPACGRSAAVRPSASTAAAESAVVGSPSRPPSACPAPLDVCRLAHCRRSQFCHRRRLCPRRPQAGRLLGRTRRRRPPPMTLVRLRSRSASSLRPAEHHHQGKRARMATFMTIGYGDRAGCKATAQAVRDA